MLSGATRVIIAICGALIAFAGLAVAAVGGAGGIGGLWMAGVGAAIVIAVTIERNRYRSEAADATLDPTGPGGGEPSGALEPRFRPTDELFVDPTTQHKMRVHVDPRTGERRYVAEG
jgi:hypothetical protein